MADIYQLPDGNSNSVPAWYPALNNGGLGANGWGGGILGFLLGLVFGNGGFGGWGGNGNGQAQNFLMEAINNNGERSTAAIQALASTLNQDFNLVNSSVQTIQGALATLSAQHGLTGQQIINAIQAGNASLGTQFQQMCCNNQLAMTKGFGDVQLGLQAMGSEDRLAICQQTNTLVNGANANTQAILAKIDAVEDSRKDREIAALTAKISQLESQNYMASVAQSAVTPVINQLQGIRAEVDAIKRCQPQMITLPNNSMTAVPTLWANAFADNIVDKLSTAINNTVNGTTTTTPTTQG